MNNVSSDIQDYLNYRMTTNYTILVKKVQQIFPYQ